MPDRGLLRFQHSTGPTDPAIEGEFTGVVAIAERPTLGRSNLIINRDEPFGPARLLRAHEQDLGRADHLVRCCR